MAALLRRHGIFTTLFRATARAQIDSTLKPFSTEAEKVEQILQKVVTRFKKSCENKSFRREKGVYAHYIRRLAGARQFDLVEEILEHQKKYPEIQREGFVARLICLYGESGMFEHARKLFDEMPELGCPRTVMSFNCLLKSATAAKEFHKVVESFNDLPSSVSIEPDVISQNTLIHALCELGSVEEALSKLREMGNKADIVTFNTLLSALYKTGRFSEAEGLWAEMVDTGVKPNLKSYNYKLRAMFSEKKIDEAVLLAADMQSKGIEADVVTYNTLIIGFCGNGRLDDAKQCYNDIRKKKFGPRLVNTYLVLIPACCEAGDFDKAYKLFLDAKKYKISLNTAMCTRIIDGLTEKGRTEEALKLKKLTLQKE